MKRFMRKMESSRNFTKSEEFNSTHLDGPAQYLNLLPGGRACNNCTPLGAIRREGLSYLPLPAAKLSGKRTGRCKDSVRAWTGP